MSKLCRKDFSWTAPFGRHEKGAVDKDEEFATNLLSGKPCCALLCCQRCHFESSGVGDHSTELAERCQRWPKQILSARHSRCFSSRMSFAGACSARSAYWWGSLVYSWCSHWYVKFIFGQSQKEVHQPNKKLLTLLPVTLFSFPSRCIDSCFNIYLLVATYCLKRKLGAGLEPCFLNLRAVCLPKVSSLTWISFKIFSHNSSSNLCFPGTNYTYA